jgi:peptidoglycan/xylan/chitin deacetylase (PgdA/CDA1 family)
MLKRLKRFSIGLARTAGVEQRIAMSRWRRDRLLILGFHGVSLEDEHLWNPGIYLHRDAFRQRLELLVAEKCNILPLGDALRLLQLGTLPPRSVVLTFDDGHYDFFEIAYPILAEFGFPATVYLTTYYSGNNVPVFDLITSYLLWKGRTVKHQVLDHDGASIELQVVTPVERQATLERLYRHAAQRRLSGAAKDELASRLADVLHVDYERMRALRTLHILNSDEVTSLAQRGVSFQLHTHTHRVPLEEGAFRREIQRNAEVVRKLTGDRATHFCYPSGAWHPRMFRWLRAEGIQSAVTCAPALAARGMNLMCLPRIMDHGGLAHDEYRAWLSGFAQFLPKLRSGGNGRINEGEHVRFDHA